MSYHLSRRRYRRVLQRSGTESPRRHTRGRTVSIIRATQSLGRFVVLSLFNPRQLTDVVSIATDDQSPLSSQTILACSASSKMVASCVTYPHEVLRTRLQVHRTEHGKRQASAAPLIGSAIPAHAVEPIPKDPPKGLIEEAKFIFKNSGLKGFYRGLSINLVRTVPSNAVTMLT